MKTEVFKNLVDSVNDQRLGLIGIRGTEYAKVSDQVSSFKEVAQMAKVLDIVPGMKPSQFAYVMVLLKLMRNSNLKNEDPYSERRWDTILDLHNYIDLAIACELDEWPIGQPRKETPID